MKPDAAVQTVHLRLLDSLVGYHLRRTAGAFFADFNARLEPLDMRQGLFGILAAIGENPGISQGLVGRVLGIQRANMVSLVTELIDRGFVDRVVDAADRRAFTLTLTPAGQAMLDEATDLVRAHENALLADLSQAEQVTLIDLLGRVRRIER